MSRDSDRGVIIDRHPKYHDFDYSDFLIASPPSALCCEAAQPTPVARPACLRTPAHAARLDPDPDTPFAEVEPLLDKGDGALVVDDSSLD